MGIASAAWCVACGELPVVAISYERKGIMAHYGACALHIHDVADRVLHDLDRIDTEQRSDIRPLTPPSARIVPGQRLASDRIAPEHRGISDGR